MNNLWNTAGLHVLLWIHVAILSSVGLLGNWPTLKKNVIYSFILTTRD